MHMNDIKEDMSRKILEFLKSKKQGASGSQIADALGINRLTLAKDLEVLRALGVIDFQQVGAAKLWFKGKGTPANAILEEVLFGVLPAYLSEIVDEKPVSEQIRDITDRVLTNVLKADTVIHDKAKEYPSIYNCIISCYKYVGGFHKKFDAELLEEDDEKLVVRINICPHEAYTKNNPLACSACNGLKRALLRELHGITKPIEITKRISNGDPYCEYIIYKK